MDRHWPSWRGNERQPPEVGLAERTRITPYFVLVTPALRDEVVEFVRHWSERTEIAYERLTGWIGLPGRKFRDWRSRYGKANEHNCLVPRDHWLENWDKRAIPPPHSVPHSSRASVAANKP